MDQKIDIDLIHDAERALLGSILIEGSVRDVSGEIDLTPDDFLNTYHKDIYRTILKCSKNNELPNVVNVPRQMFEDDLFPKDKNGIVPNSISYFMSVLVATCPSSLEYESYAKTVKYYSDLIKNKGKKKPKFKGTV